MMKFHFAHKEALQAINASAQTQNDDPKERHNEESNSRSDHNDAVSLEAQAGVRTVEAVATVWTRKALICAYAGYVIDAVDGCRQHGLMI